MSETVAIGDATISVVERGAANSDDVILFVHGFPLDHSMWQGQLVDLAKDFRCLAPDLRGFGSSSVTAGTVSMEQFADDLEQLLAALRIDAVTFCGLSMGGYIAWEMWRRHPDRLRRLILCDTRAEADSAEMARGRHLMAQQVEQEGMQGVADTMIPKLFAADSLKHQTALVESVRTVINQSAPAAVAAAQRGMATRCDFVDQLAAIKLPTLAICGQQDVITTCREMREMAENLPSAKFVGIAAAGHLAPLEQPAKVNAAIREFVRTT